ncbi:catechol-2,3-dioxygenase [Evansella vedderi]|uniref:Catechol-2,3-dioxygenase n=1 Tax=Evansella vedderi TaxID=38282 RepID=A0ABU0A2W3_9BACI|nr:hypothetical protein [Evansella vedderi]MDQ0256690.1 catechol-2,3-dioxygenase [Evansella vedderi]
MSAFLSHLVENGVQIGASDHLVSEAFNKLGEAEGGDSNDERGI